MNFNARYLSSRTCLRLWRVLITAVILFICMGNIFTLLKGGMLADRKDSEIKEAMQPLPTKNTANTIKHNIAGDQKALSTESPKAEPVPKIKNPMWLEIHKMDSFFTKDILLLGKKRKEKAFVVFGIPTVERDRAYYVLDTVKSLMENANSKEKSRMVIVVFIADFSIRYKEKVVYDIRSSFQKEVDDGVIQVIVGKESFYPDFNKIPLLYGDTKERVHWRSKQSLDYSFMYYYCGDLAEYYVQLEDDIITKKNYFSTMKNFIESRKTQWSVLEFGARGFIGMTYRAAHLKYLAKYIRFYYWTMPVDWLFRIFNDIWLFGNSGKNAIKPPLFLHVGVVSSLKGQIRKLDDFRNRHLILKKYQSKNGNPKVKKITTDIKEYVQPNSIMNAYQKEGFFWGKTIRKTNFIEIILETPQELKQIVFVSGTNKYPDDIFGETELFISTETLTPCSNYKSVKTFSEMIVNYSFDKTSSPAAGPVQCVKLVINKVHTDRKGNPKWLIIQEIALLL